MTTERELTKIKKREEAYKRVVEDLNKGETIICSEGVVVSLEKDGFNLIVEEDTTPPDNLPSSKAIKFFKVKLDEKNERN